MDVACLTNQSEPSTTVKEDGQSTPSELPCRPEVISYDATDDYIGKLEEWFLQTSQILFLILTNTALPVMSGNRNTYTYKKAAPHIRYTLQS